MNSVIIEKKLFNNLHYKNAKVKFLIFLFFSVIISWYLSHRNYLLFHSVVELFSIVIALSIFITAFNTYVFSSRNFFLFLGIAYAFIGGFDLLHTLSYKGINIIGDGTANLATQLWVTARYLEGLSLLIAFFVLKKSIRPSIVFLSYSAVSAVLMLSIFNFGIFPDCYIEGTGLTLFKILSEYIICVIFVSCIIILYLKKEELKNNNIYSFLILSLYTSIISEILFTLYVDVYGFSNMLGHIFKALSFYFIYKAITELGLKTPYKLLSQTKEALEIKNSKLESVISRLKQEIDINARLQRELIEREEQYRSIVELSPYAVLVKYKDQFILANDLAKRLVNPLDMDEVACTQLDEILYNSPGHSIVQEITDHIDTEPFLEKKMITQDGRLIDTEIAATSIPYKGETATLIIIRDITAKRRMKELREKAEKDSQLLEQVREYDRLKTEFFSNISHELKTPLNVILGSIQLIDLDIKTDFEALDAKSMKKHVRVMRQNCYRLLRLINNLIDITRIDSGFLKMHLQNCDIVSVVEDITQSIADYTESKGIELIFDTSVEEKVLACDPDKIERIMLNLLSNAIKFTEPGGSIMVTMYDKIDKVIISVKDTGAGIPKDKLEIIFERFRQVDGLLSRNHEGSGIGLSLVKSLVELHQGKISAKSEYSKGSEFIVELPVHLLSEDKSESEEINTVKQQSNTERIHIEFSDIYL